MPLLSTIFKSPLAVSGKISGSGRGLFVLGMKNIILILLITLPFCCFSQQPGFRKLYSGDITGAGFVDILWDGEKLITSGQFLTDTAPNNALNGLLYMELDTNGNTLFTDIYFHPNDAVGPGIGNSIHQSYSGLIYSMNQMVYDTSTNLLAIYNNSERIKVVLTPVNALQSYLLSCVDWNQNLLFSGRIQNYQYKSEGMLIKSDPMGNEIWRKYYGYQGLDCGVGEPYILDSNTIILPGFKRYWPDSGPILNKWTKTWVVAVDSLGNIKWEWDSPKNVESGISTRMLKLSDGNWLYVTAQFIPMPGQIDNFGMHPKIVCRDNNFNLVWERYLPAVPTTACYTIDLQPTSDGNFIVAGFLNDSEWWGAQVIHKFASNGDSIWTYRDYCDPFLGCDHYLGGVTELPGGSIVAAGYYEDLAEAKAYGLLIKLDKNGCLDTLCGAGWIGTAETERVSRIKVYPNPVSNILTIDNPIGERIELFDLFGKLVRTVPVQAENQSINISDLPVGAYLVRMQEKTLRVSYKVIKQ